jgi:glyoxylase-like metal-dependent hydrolase (beta-lactamase superfamily II)
MPDQLPAATTRVVKTDGNVKVHTFISPEAFLANATHIIEGPHELIVIDGQFVVPYAMQFRAYADSLGKPISRVYLSHAHPDHFFGIGAAFSDTQIYALPETIEFLKQAGEGIRAALSQVYGAFVTDKVAIPQNVAREGKDVVDGIEFEVVKNTDSETDFQLALKFPQLGIYGTQDLIYSGAHLYINKNFDHWISILEDLKASEYDLFLPGHGAPADKDEIQNNIDYLKTAKQKFAEAENKEAFKNAMLAAFPDRTGAAVMDIYLPRLYEEAGAFAE